MRLDPMLTPALTAVLTLAPAFPLAAQKAETSGTPVVKTSADRKEAVVVPAPQTGTAPNAVFEYTQLDLGTFLEGESAKGRFPIHNTRDVPVSLSGFQKSCTCSSATIEVGDVEYVLKDQPSPNTIYRIAGSGDDAEEEIVEAIELAPGEKGVVKVETDLKNVAGRKAASLTLRTDDEKLPIISLNWSATAAQYFQLVPNEVNLNNMRWNDERKFTVRVTSTIQPDFEILGHDELPPKMTIEYKKVEVGGRTSWEINGTYGPNVPADSAGGIVNFRTNLENKTFPLRVIAWVEGPLEVKPGGFLQMGRVPADEGSTKSIEFVSRDGVDLQVEKVEIQEASIGQEFLEIAQRKEGSKLFVDVTIKPGAPRRLAYGTFVVHLDHPVVKTKTFQFNGFVR